MKQKHLEKRSPRKTTIPPPLAGRKRSFYRPAYFALFVLAAIYFTAFYNKDFLLWAEEISLFLPTRLFLADCMKTAGGLLSYAGTFFVQFFYYPLLGSFLLILLLLFIQFLTVRAFAIPKSLFPLSFVPSILLLLSITETGYELITVKLPGYLFAGSLGIAACLSGFWLYRKIPSGWMRSLFLVSGVVLTYPLFGFYALFSAFLCVLYELFSFVRDKNVYRLFILSAGVFSIGFVPYFFYARIYSQMQWSGIYLAALPNWFDTMAELPLWLPFLFLFLCLSVFLAFLFKKTYPGIKKAAVISSGIFVFSLLFLYFHSFRDENFRTELQMNQAIEANNWGKAVAIGKKRNQTSSEPVTRLIVLYYNLALYKQGTAGDRLFSIDHHSTLPRAIYPELAQMHQGGNALYFHSGKINFCYRWCMENKVEYGLNIRQLKYMVKCSLVNGNSALAQKYNNILQKTFFHKTWAGKYQKYINDYSLLKEEAELQSLIPLRGYENSLETDGNQLENYLLNSFAYMNSGTPEMLELSLLCNLMLKNGENFMPRLAFYAQKHQQLPVHYQEAALLFSFLGKTDTAHLNLEQRVVDRFNQWLAMHKQYKNQPEEYKKTIFKPLFGNTFWYYFSFIPK
jgi:hypothetical protein